ncbi:P-loop containing nucleoside triphosphate hydrolase protein [Lojkania enalia]|uniref:P-loop containing nucleoside triphosphate hydrolase protein n=1 Tax=Lojkania enalia TaxID=147567 RepID=A0A9P4KBX3_9PLEO|nr:P-loop containing nucleoside triphosphate hydrolase protein [Didymosphaeria enalia]
MAAPLLLRQIWTLAWKDILLILNPKRRNSTIFRSLTIPIIFVIYVSFIIKVYWPTEKYGVATPSDIRPLSEAIRDAPGERRTLALCNYGPIGGDIDRVIEAVASEARGSDGQIIQILRDPNELLTLCKTSLSAVSKCYAAAEFFSSPNEGGSWHYEIRVDGALGYKIDVHKNTNDAQLIPIPLQHAIDAAIASVNSTGGAQALPSNIKEYPYTSKTQKEWDDSVVTSIQSANTKYIAIVWYIGFIGLCYQLVGVMAREREQGMADLLESMMPNVRRWEPQVARLLGRWLAFTLVYFPSFIIMAIIAKAGLFPKTNTGILIVFFILTGLSLNSFSLLGAAFFKKAQLSGITVTCIALLLGILAQISQKTISTGAVAILSILFTPMTFVYSMIFLARYENKQIAPNLVEMAPGASWRLPGLVLWIFMIIQIFAYPILAALVEHWLYHTASQGRSIIYNDSAQPVLLTNFTKHYYPNWFFRNVAPVFSIKRTIVRAVTDVSIAPMKGQIMVLVGANGCGKSTTLNAIAGLGGVTSGSITVNGSGGIGICPQKNVLWDHLTVEQHAKIFNRIKSSIVNSATESELSKLISDCGLTQKNKSISQTLSGGQKRKLQLILMLTGGSQVCCVDEVSGGLDPLSRRKIWDILLAERGKRTILLTTHFLDEAEFLADHMVIMSKGSLKAEGSVSELKSKLGGGFRFHFLHGSGYGDLPDVEELFIGEHKESMFDQTIYTVKDTKRSVRIIKELEERRVKGYQVTGPTIEEVFMKLAEDPDALLPSHASLSSNDDQNSHKTPHHEKNANFSASEAPDEPLMTGKALTFLQQSFILFRKRLTILKRNYLPYTSAFLIPIIATAAISVLLYDRSYGGCEPNQQVRDADIQTLDDDSDYKPFLVVGPLSALTNVNLTAFQSMLPPQFGDANSSLDAFQEYIQIVNSLDEFNAYIRTNFSKVTPGGFFLGEEPVFSYWSNIGFLGVYSSIFMQNAVDMLLTNTSIQTTFRPFNIPWREDATNQIQFIFYFGLIMSCYPAFFALYPTVERLRKIRALQYSNGARPLPLWLAYLSFDWLNVLITSGIMTIILAASTADNWWNIGYLFVALFLYGMAALLTAYIVSQFAKSQLSAFAIAAGWQGFMLLMYFTGIMNIQSQLDIAKVDDALSIFNYTFNTVTPSGCLIRALIIAMNMFSSLCHGSPPKMSTYPGEFRLYGQPILYLVAQSAIMFIILLIIDHKWASGWFKRKFKVRDAEEQETREPEVSEEIERVKKATDGLRVEHLTRAFKSRRYGSIIAVDDVTFGVKKGEVFSIVGPNGAGKSTTIGMLRGELKPTQPGAQIHLGNIDVMKDRRTARSRLGVCPQFDAVDQMTVLEHLEFYAGVRGVSDAERNARQIVKAVGLEKFANLMASRLSGGNKRKLSLGIALIGNPELVLLDEPSSGMDPLAKRTIWKTLADFVPGRSVLLTTHSMEEADHLADRVGVLAKRMLDVGTTDHLRKKHGHGFHIQVICKSAPHTSNEEMEVVKQWVEATLPGAQLEGFSYHGQMRYNIPSKMEDGEEKGENGEELSVGKLFVLLEENKERLGLEYYSVSPSTFDEVFLRVVEKHNIGEEDLTPKKRGWKLVLRKLIFPFW